MLNNPARSYRQMACEGASRVGLVVLLYEAALGALHRAVEALEEENIEAKTHELDHVLDVIAQLRGSLDLDRGGEVARTLDRFYQIARERILEASATKSKPILVELSSQFLSLREAWEQVDRSVAPPLPPAEAEGNAAGLAFAGAGLSRNSSHWSG
jgi:flagellar protein FliS